MALALSRSGRLAAPARTAPVSVRVAVYASATGSAGGFVTVQAGPWRLAAWVGEPGRERGEPAHHVIAELLGIPLDARRRIMHLARCDRFHHLSQVAKHGLQQAGGRLSRCGHDGEASHADRTGLENSRQSRHYSQWRERFRAGPG
jgi:hypothetical protein